ncbi:hypothetical protein CASFOL_028892 [Castilleja foliolosa]|uniref:F-box domain-containing protein n=1 Tax=Castilleja foliolosa TaxID=1961234 RepID=A0ABD3CE04_9LAMI
MAAIAELPQELIAVIMSKLPVKSLLRFKCVCKSWYSLIKSPNFIHLHLNNSSSNHNCIMIRRCIDSIEQDIYCFQQVLSFYSHETLADLGIQIDTPFPTSYGYYNVSGPCNGLICMTKNTDQILIINPATREFRSLFVPQRGYYFDTVAFGLDPNSGEYKVVTIGLHYDHTRYSSYDKRMEYSPCSPPKFRGDREAVVYDFSTDSWRETGIVFPEPFNYSQKSITLNGAFHWMPVGAYRNVPILSFRISDEVIEPIPLPGFYSWEHENHCADLFVLNKSLAIVFYYCTECFEISVMNEYGVKDSWAKLVKLGPMPFAYTPLAFWNSNDEDMLLLEGKTDVESPMYDGHLISCSLQHQTVEHFPIYGNSTNMQNTFDIFMYSESLVSVNSIGKSA